MLLSAQKNVAPTPDQDPAPGLAPVPEPSPLEPAPERHPSGSLGPRSTSTARYDEADAREHAKAARLQAALRVGGGGTAPVTVTDLVCSELLAQQALPGPAAASVAPPVLVNVSEPAPEGDPDIGECAICTVRPARGAQAAFAPPRVRFT